MSPNSSRSSRKSFDKNADYFDLLRIHSVVQAFFIDTLVEDKEVHFWLERATAVFCRSFDRADQRIKEDSKIGLPDDYRRYAIHGRRLMEHIDRFEKKAPEFLGRVRDQIERRLKRTDAEIDQLSHTIQAHIINGSGTVPPASVFERTSSSSETDSTTPPSHSSMDESNAILDEDSQVLSPTPYDNDYIHDPYHWHVPYPHRPTMPPTPDPDDDDGNDALTVIGGPTIINGGSGAITPTNGPSFGPTGPAGPSKGLLQPPRAYADWELAVPQNRVVRKVEDHHYYPDRAGAWRDSTVSDPRVSISREIAKGSIPSIRDRSSSPNRGNVTAESEAELHLHKIRTAAPPSPRSGGGGGGYLDMVGSLGSSVRSRPRLIMGTNSYADPSATKTPESEFSMLPAQFSTSLAGITSSPSNWTTATIKRLKENLNPPRSSSVGPRPKAGPKENNHEATGAASHGGRPVSSSEPLFRGSRSLTSSPRSRSPQFRPPPPVEMVTSSPQQYLPPTVHHWETHAYHPNIERLASSGLGYPQDPMSLSYPFPQRDTYPNALHRPIQQRPWVHPPGGYTSQPMTRDVSHQSASPVSIPHSTPPLHYAQPAIPSSPTRAQSPLAGSPPSRPSSSMSNRTVSRLFSIRRRRRGRQGPSHTETELSPSLEATATFPDARTNYRQQNMPSPGDDLPASPTPRFTRPSRGRSAAAAAEGRRAQSQSPTPTAMTRRGSGRRPLGRFTPRRRGTGPWRGRQEELGGGGSSEIQERRSPTEMFASSEPGFGAGIGSGSGGFMLADGTIVGFGDIVAPNTPPGSMGGRRRLAKRARRPGGWASGDEDGGGEGDGVGLGLGIR